MTATITRKKDRNSFNLNLKDYTAGMILSLLHSLWFYVSERRSPVAHDAMVNIVYGIIEANLPVSPETDEINKTIAEIRASVGF